MSLLASAASRTSLAVALLVAVLFAVATVRELRIGARAIAQSDTSLAHADPVGAIARARDAAEAAAPGSPYPRQGYARLETIARDAEAHGDERIALAAWGAMRAASTATSSPLISPGGWRALADEGITRVGAHPLTPSAEVHATDETIRIALARSDVPGALGLLALGAGALAFFGGCARLLWAARDFASLRAERLAMAAAGAGAVLYAVACLRA